MNIDALPYVAFLSESPSVFYGPFTATEAFEFVASWNDFFVSIDTPGKWVAVPMVPARPATDYV